MSARCGVHPEVAAVETCTRCGKFLCGNCLELEGETPYCASCRLRARRRPLSRFQKFSLVAGILLAVVVVLALLML